MKFDFALQIWKGKGPASMPNPKAATGLQESTELHRLRARISELEAAESDWQSERDELIGEMRRQDSALKSLAETRCLELEGLSRQCISAIAETDTAVGSAIESFLTIQYETEQLSESARLAIGQVGVELAEETVAFADKSTADFLNSLLNMAGSTADAAQGMDELSQMTPRLNLLLEQIDRISNKTIILALNASIEAARAGNAGRAFNVIANQIRTLALQTQTAAEGVHRLSEDFQRETERLSGQLSEATGKSRDEAVQVQGVLTLLKERVRENGSRGESSVQDLSERSEMIAAQLSRIVLALQFQDMVRQRLEHVAAPLDEIRFDLCSLAGLPYSGPTPGLPAAPGANPSLQVVSYGAADDNIELFG